MTLDAELRYNNNWTPYIIDFLARLAPQFSCIGEPSYRGIDVPYFDRTGHDWSEWAMEAAIEVENRDRTWLEEISKLLLLNAGLKVLIAYENDPKTAHEMLARFPAIYHSRKYNNAAGWLFIFGPRTLPPTHDFSAYTFDGTRILDITDGLRILV
jgi:hypothetical protein